MNKEEFSRRIIAMLPVLHRVAFAQLPQAADREDAVQETIRRAWEQRHRLREERYMQTWVIRILLNVCHSMQRRARRTTPVETLQEGTAAPSETPLLDALLSLEERFRLPLQLRYVEEYTVAEVARILRLPEGTVKSRLSRGREKLRALLKEEVFE